MTEQPTLKTNIVPPVGPLDAKICFIGQSPGAEEDYACEPFVGSAGQLLNRCMAQVGLARSSVLLYNVFVQRPPNNDAGYFFQDKQKRMLTWEGQRHVDNLKQWLEGLNPRPNVLVALGYESMFVLTGKRRPWKWRGSILPCTLVPGYKVYPMLHPSGVLRLLNEPAGMLQGAKKEMANNALPLFLRDLERVIIQGEFPEIKYPKRNFDLNLSELEILDKLTWLNDTNQNSSVDIETLQGPDGPIVWQIGFSHSPDYAFVIYLIKGGTLNYPIETESKILRAISRYFLNPKAKKVFQNGAYDLSILGRYYGLRVADGTGVDQLGNRISHTWEDTMWCHHASFPQIKKSLETQTSIYTWEPYYKDEGKTNYGKRGSDLAEAQYNAKDCCVTREIWPIVERNAKEQFTWNGYRRSMSFMPSLLGMMIRGVKIDVEKKKELEINFGAQAKFHLHQIWELEGEEININSSQQMVKCLYYKHGFKVQMNHKTKRPTTDKDALQKLKRLYPNEPILEHILEFRKFEKLHGTYTQMQIGGDGRARTSYGFTSTWRLTSSESHFGGGGNLQNIPMRTDEGREIRKLFITDNTNSLEDEAFRLSRQHVSEYGHPKTAEALINGRLLLLRIDLSQAEARDVAWEAQDYEKMEQFLDPHTDVHWENAKIVFDLPRSLEYDKQHAKKKEVGNPITNSHHSLYEYRSLGKTVVHAANYGMGPIMLQIILAREGFIINQNLAKRLLQGYIDRNPQLENWHREIREKVRATRTLVSSFGRKRSFYGRFNDNLWRVAYAFSPQNTVGEMLEQSIQQVWEQCDYIQPLLNVHDEMVAQLEPHNLARAVRDCKKIFEIPLTIKGQTLIIPAEFSIGMNWGECEELSNETVAKCCALS